MKYRSVFLLVEIFFSLLAMGQEYVVESFENVAKDLTAKTNPRIDNNGRKCGLIKVYVKDAITAAKGPVIGDIVNLGMEKWVYVSHDAKQVQLLFKEHMPLYVTFEDYNYPTLTGQMTYILKLKESNNNQLLQNDNNSIALNETKDQSIVYTAIKLSNPDGEINRRGYVDLGLPSGLKWAICNIGTTLPEASGDYFAWGETSRKYNYNSKSSQTANKKKSKLLSKGIIDSSGNLTPSYDAAQINWGGSWRIPTKDEIQELKDNCQWIWTTIDGKNGYIVVGPKNKSIFLPAAGQFDESILFNKDEVGFYWTSSVNLDHNQYAYSLFTYDKSIYLNPSFRYCGMSVRPVSD